ncbi:unnamed protein product [Penicillium egyptiacum]|uniref:Uncharacterized protein n=1 Tax=Penicillium egyptiacum TaxID=1303716 RepID=A0A9W4KD04_9EURO|nr:unnamed protein product [Penicillium egyptiacum]
MYIIVLSKVNLTNFPELSKLHLRRPLSVAGMDTSSVMNESSNAVNCATKITASDIAQASTAAQSTADQVGDHLQTLFEDLKLHLPAYYIVGLYGYCQGDNSTGPFTNCSKPSTSFSFDLLGIFGSQSEEINDILPKDDNKVLAGYHDVSGWTISAYILGFTFTVAAIIIQVPLLMFSKGKNFLVASSIIEALT